MTDNSSLHKLLQEIANQENFEEPEIQVKEVTSGGANFSSVLYRVTITEKNGKTTDRSIKLFAKKAAMGEDIRKNIGSFQGYTVEQIAYTDLFQTYRGLEKKHNVFEEHKLVFPKYYGADPTYLQETIVLEDLASRGFELYSRFKSVDWPYAKSAVTELAKFHALSFALQHDNPIEFNKILNKFQTPDIADNEETRASTAKVFPLAIDTVKDKNKVKLRKFLDGASIQDYIKLARPHKYTTLIHSDFRPSNMLFRKTENGATEVIPVDYQTINPGCPAADLVYFIVCGTDGPFRAQYFQQLVDFYHSELGAALHRLGLDVNNVYPREEFDSELKQKLPHGLAIAVISLPLHTSAEDQAPKPEDFNLSSSFGVAAGDLYRTRLNELVDDFVAWGLLTD